MTLILLSITLQHLPPLNPRPPGSVEIEINMPHHSIADVHTQLGLNIYISQYSNPDPNAAFAQVSPSVEDLRGLSYARIASGRVRSELRSELPISAEAEQLYDLDSDLFTEEALQGMQE